MPWFALVAGFHFGEKALSHPEWASVFWKGLGPRHRSPSKGVQERGVAAPKYPYAIGYVATSAVGKIGPGDMASDWKQ